MVSYRAVWLFSRSKAFSFSFDVCISAEVFPVMDAAGLFLLFTCDFFRDCFVSLFGLKKKKERQSSKVIL